MTGLGSGGANFGRAGVACHRLQTALFASRGGTDERPDFGGPARSAPFARRTRRAAASARSPTGLRRGAASPLPLAGRIGPLVPGALASGRKGLSGGARAVRRDRLLPPFGLAWFQSMNHRHDGQAAAPPQGRREPLFCRSCAPQHWSRRAGRENSPQSREVARKSPTRSLDATNRRRFNPIMRDIGWIQRGQWRGLALKNHLPIASFRRIMIQIIP